MEISQGFFARACAQDVGVSVVGKYRYLMASPAENDRVPVVVDIILVGSAAHCTRRACRRVLEG